MSNNTKSPKSIPVPPQQRLAAAIEARVKHPLNPAVDECIKAQDLLILAGEITDRKPLGWVIEALNTPETELVQRSKMIDTACKVFDGIVKAIEAETRTAEAQPEIDAALFHAVEILEWAEAGWKGILEGFSREMRGINPTTLTAHLGFTDQQVNLSEKVDGKPQWGVLSLYDVAYRVASDEVVLQNRAFRRAALSGFASFFRFAFGQTGSEDQELLDRADEIVTLLYGEDAQLTDRSRGGNTLKQPESTSTAPRKKAAARKAAAAGRPEKKADEPKKKAVGDPDKNFVVLGEPNPQGVGGAPAQRGRAVPGAGRRKNGKR